VALPVQALSSLAVSIYLPSVPAQQTTHIASHATTYYAAGNHTADISLVSAGQFDHWFQIQGIDVEGSATARTAVAFGDSITDGSGTTSNANQRWTDILAERLQASPATHQIAIINEGIGGNRLLHDGVASNGLARFDRDVLAQPGATTVILLEGVNDLGSISRDGPVTPARRAEAVSGVIDAYRQIILRAHDHGLRIIGATILPFGGTRSYRSDADADADRQQVNAWIREPGHFDAVVDFDQAVHDPAHPNQLLPAYDSGDHLHPSPAGYRAMADSIPISELIR
jgi:lysophospholipase L1-like esterase